MMAPHEMDPRIPAPGVNEDPVELKLMISGQPYKSGDPYVGRIRDAHGVKVQQINRIDEMEIRMNALRELVHMGKEVWIVQGLFFEYVSVQDFARVWTDFIRGVQYYYRRRGVHRSQLHVPRRMPEYVWHLLLCKTYLKN
jgi:hypothetical protein